MHVEVSVALNFLMSYLYNKLPRRRVDVFGEELEKGLKRKFSGHWYPDKPFKGSGFRCVRCNGEQVDPVIVSAVQSAGLDLDEVKQYIPEEMTLWIDPSEVSYRISEKSAIKVLYTDRPDDDAGCDTNDREVQAANHTFNPEAQSFQPIHPLSSSLSSLSLSPSSPQPPPGTWSTSVSPSSSLFSSPLLSSSSSGCHQSINSSLKPVAPVFLGASTAISTPKFTAASFAATKFGSTKLKSQAKRPTRLSPTHLSHYFRHQQQGGGLGCGGLAVTPTSASPQRPRSLSPRDPRLEFLLDKQARSYPRGSQLSSPSGLFPSSSSTSFAHSLQQQQALFSHDLSPSSSLPFSLVGEAGLHTTPHLSPNGQAAFPEMLDPAAATGMLSPASSLSPDAPKSFVEGLQHIHGFSGARGYPGSGCYPGGSGLQHLLVAN